MLEGNKISEFFAAVAGDPRVSPTHVSLYMALFQFWRAYNYKNPFQVFSHQVMPVAKILSSDTYYKTIRDLSDFGYIRYEPSYKRNQGSKIYLQVE